MRVGLLVPEFPPDTIGGGGVIFEGLAEGLHARGHELVVVTASTAGAPLDRARRPFELRRLAEFAHPSARWKSYMPPVPQPALLQAAAALRGCDVINAHGYGFAFIDLLAALVNADARMVLSLHGFPYTAPRSGGVLAQTYGAYDRLLGRRLLRRAAAVTAISRAAAEEARAVAPREIAIVPNALTPLPLPEPGERAQSDGAFVMVGRIEHLKGIDRVIRALAFLHAAGRTVPRVVVIGRDGGEQAALQAMAGALGVGEAMSFAGQVPREKLAPEYMQALGCIVASRTESFSLAALEAMSLGCPVVAPLVGGLRDFLEDECNGLAVDADDPAAFAAALERLSGGSGLRQELGGGGKKTAARYTWDAVLDGYEAVYRRAIDGAAHRQSP